MNKEGGRKIMRIILAIIALIMLIVAIAVFFWEYASHGAPNYITVALSIGTILLSLYYFTQAVKRPQDILFEQQKISSVIRCMSCDYVTAREFTKGDYILKEVGACPRCGGSLIIYSIFREVKEKEKHYD